MDEIQSLVLVHQVAMCFRLTYTWLYQIFTIFLSVYRKVGLLHFVAKDGKGYGGRPL